MRGNVSYVILVFLLVAWIIIQGVGVGTASPRQAPTVSVDPLISTADVDKSFTVNVTVTDIVISETPPVCHGLIAWSVKLAFDPDILNCTGVEEGPFLKQVAETAFPTPNINNTAGFAFIVDIYKPPLPTQGATGSGVLATVTFQVKSEDRTLLNFETTKLDTVIAGSKVKIYHVAEDGLFDNTGAENTTPVAIFHAEPPVAEVNETIVFDASASYDPDGWLSSYYWDFGDGTNSSGIVQHVPRNTDMVERHSYKQGGTYTVTLNVTDYYSGTDTATADITIGRDIAITEVKAPPAALVGESISINVTIKNEGCENETFNVTVYYDSSVVDTWTDVSLAVGSNTTLIFKWNTTGVPEGIYAIRANATIVEGEVDKADNVFPRGDIPSVKVTVSAVPIHDIAIIDVTASPSEVIVGGSVSINVTLENQGTGPEEGFDVSVYYDSTLIQTQTDISLATGSKTLTFTWNTTGVEAGQYSIMAEASRVQNETDTADNVKSFDGVITVLWHPDAKFTCSLTEPVVGETVTFNASLSTAYDGTIESYAWDFGDGSPTVTESDPITTHTYTASGTYNATLTVTDDDNLTDTATQSITVREAGPKVPLSVVAVVVAMILMVIIVAYFMRARKTV